MVRIVRETAGEFFARSRLGGREARGLDGGYGVKILNGCGADQHGGTSWVIMSGIL